MLTALLVAKQPQDVGDSVRMSLHMYYHCFEAATYTDDSMGMCLCQGGHSSGSLYFPCSAALSSSNDPTARSLPEFYGQNDLRCGCHALQPDSELQSKFSDDQRSTHRQVDKALITSNGAVGERRRH